MLNGQKRRRLGIRKTRTATPFVLGRNVRPLQQEADGPVNKFKLKFLNATLKSINKIVGDYRPFPDFEQFDVDSLPSNSDVVVIVSQYAGAVLRFRAENTDYEHGQSWILKGKTSNLHAGNPSNFKYRPK